MNVMDFNYITYRKFSFQSIHVILELLNMNTVNTYEPGFCFRVYIEMDIYK